MSVDQLKQGIRTLKKRQNYLIFWCTLSASLAVLSAITFFYQQDLVYGWFGLTTQVQQLHIPISLNNDFQQPHVAPDYLSNLLGWLGWLFLKVFLSFFGAFIAVSILKKIRFFYIRFQSFVLKFVGWLIAFIVLWSSLTYLLYEDSDDKHQPYSYLTDYQSHIQESQLAHELHLLKSPDAISGYMLAQTALLHEPADLQTAQYYMNQVIEAEKIDPQFNQYGFKPEQIWTMQHQIYGKSISSLAQNLDATHAQAEQVSKWAQMIVLAVGIFALISMLIFWLMAGYIGKKVEAIEKRISY